MVFLFLYKYMKGVKVMNINVVENKSVVATDSIVVIDAEGNEVTVATLYGTVDKNGSTSYCFNVMEEDIYKANRESIQTVVDKFIADLNAEATRLLAITI